MNKKILVLGKGGQVGSNLVELLAGEKNKQVLALDKEEIDLSKPKTVFDSLKKLSFKPDVIVNCAAYTAVDKAEEEKEREICENINYTSVVEMTRFAKATDALLIHYSTDYVFDGSGEGEFFESNTRNLKPLNFYGQTKLDAERAIQNYDVNHLILRTSWVYNHEGHNFLRTMLKLSQEKEELKIVADQIGSPTYAYDIAQTTIKLINEYKGGMDGLYHLVPKQQISWFDFAVMILEVARELGIKFITEEVTPITTADFVVKAKRPHNSRLNTDKIEKQFGVKLPDIEDSVRKCISKIVQNNW